MRRICKSQCTTPVRCSPRALATTDAIACKRSSFERLADLDENNGSLGIWKTLVPIMNVRQCQDKKTVGRELTRSAEKSVCSGQSSPSTLRDGTWQQSASAPRLAANRAASTGGLHQDAAGRRPRCPHTYTEPP
eukprot:TRINITY_DN1739_c0_g3_i1.p1 TRINITY_DN1739_c0_g3~~TRINITY_DN1739_c0_g3_i1.p1  ORF type:complete len:134 (+),score=8.68 TRINITY_DN1739_c0_g3_i1:310-711(+)